MSIDIDIASAKAVNERLPAIVYQIGSTKDILSRLRSSVDARVLERNNLRARLSNAQKSIESVEINLLLLHRTTAQNINNYEENEVRISNRVRNVPNEPVK